MSGSIAEENLRRLRKILAGTLGLKGYLICISSVYIRLIGLGFFRKKYRELHFISRIVRPGDVVLDIGANLGYYSYFAAKSTGSKGRVIAIEPIPLFVQVWYKTMHRLRGVSHEILPFALGMEKKESVPMGIPVVEGIVRHGLTKVDPGRSDGIRFIHFEVPMEKGDDLLGEKLSRLDFIKCDVEGFEQYAIPSLENTIRRFHPILQVELLGEENRTCVVRFLSGLGYRIFILEKNGLRGINADDIFSVHQDFYFIHGDLPAERKYLLAPA